jgi:hypothetical protein
VGSSDDVCLWVGLSRILLLPHQVQRQVVAACDVDQNARVPSNFVEVGLRWLFLLLRYGAILALRPHPRAIIALYRP